MKLNHLRHVVTVAEKGGLRAAARHLGVAQPAITRSIAEAEKEVGAPLFERSARGVMLTPIGERFLIRAAAILAELERAKDEASQMLAEGVGKVRVVLSTAPHLALLPKALGPFRTKFPNVTLMLREGLFTRVHHEVEDGTLDFYVGPLYEAALPASLISELMFENRRIILCRKGHPLQHATTLRQLGKAQWISTTVTENMDAELGPVFETYGLPSPQIKLHAQSSLTMTLAAANSDLMIMVPQQWLDFPTTREFLERVHVREPLAAPAIYAVRRRRLPLTPAAQYLYDLLMRFGQELSLRHFQRRRRAGKESAPAPRPASTKS
jgi:LysR family transcriptional regulator, regulator of abg operon